MIKEIFETHINVSNYKISAEFYKKLFNIIPLYKDSNEKSKFYWIGKHEEAMFGIRENYPSPEVQRQHFAFRVDVKDIIKARNYLNELGIKSANFFGRNSEELEYAAYLSEWDAEHQEKSIKL
ncbi:VOC family protein [Bacillus sp. BP-3]|uniref:VOC family protein n=1 Tax=Bacillus sp. BP-3 TaxID=3022773 RepID=UPI00232CFF9D|nr:hypothetical protein [Bacillus sp. BP-3]MDC2867445.1 hypothetical protein [Bacillus sp. BP-3]